MTLPGTILANKALRKTNLLKKTSRLYTQRRANDRSHKIYGWHDREDCEKLIKKLKKLGAMNPRIVYSWNNRISGVRFEMEA